MNIFKAADLDKTAKLITYSIGILFLFMIFSTIVSGLKNLYITPVLLLIFVSGYLFKPVSYSIDANTLSINFLLFKKKISRSSILEVKDVQTGDLKNSVRTFAMGGLFGYNGYFYNSNFGKMSWFTTNHDFCVLIYLKNKKYLVISPKEQEEFLNFMKANEINPPKT